MSRDELVRSADQGLTKLNSRCWHLELGIRLQASSGSGCRTEVPILLLAIQGHSQLLQAVCHSMPCGRFYDMAVYSFKAFGSISAAALNL